MSHSQSQHRSNSYRSKFELDVALYLEGEGTSFSYETLTLKYDKPHTYKPDFILPNGIIIEAKGYWKSADRTKHILVRKYNPTYDIRFCFQNAYNRLSKKSKTTYASWCDKYSFEWCHKTIPKEWLI